MPSARQRAAAERRRIMVNGRWVAEDAVHGLAETYSNRSCRCELCTTAWAEQCRARAAAAKARTAQAGGASPDAVVHGAATYKNRGCRCADCTAAASRYERARDPAERRARWHKKKRTSSS